MVVQSIYQMKLIILQHKKICGRIIDINNDDDKNEKNIKSFKREPIHFYINSCGGGTCNALSIVDMMILSKTPIYTYSTGLTASAAVPLYVSVTKRFISPYGRILIHSGSICFDTRLSLQSLKESYSDFDETQNQVDEIISLHSKITKEELKNIRETRKEWYFYAEDALKYGLADELMYKLNERKNNNHA